MIRSSYNANNPLLPVVVGVEYACTLCDHTESQIIQLPFSPRVECEGCKELSLYITYIDRVKEETYKFKEGK